MAAGYSTGLASQPGRPLPGGCCGSARCADDTQGPGEAVSCLRPAQPALSRPDHLPTPQLPPPAEPRAHACPRRSRFGFFSRAPPLCLHVMCVISSPAQIGAAGFLEVPAPPNGLCLSCQCLIVPPHTPKLHLPRPSRRTAGRVAGQTPCLACRAAFRVCAGSPARRLGGRAGGRRSDDPQTARELARAAAPAQRRASPQPGPHCRQAGRIH